MSEYFLFKTAQIRKDFVFSHPSDSYTYATVFVGSKNTIIVRFLETHCGKETKQRFGAKLGVFRSCRKVVAAAFNDTDHW